MKLLVNLSMESLILTDLTQLNILFDLILIFKQLIMKLKEKASNKLSEDYRKLTYFKKNI